MAKVRQHNEWFRPVSLGNRKSCPHCKEKLPHGECIWSWGEYINAKWRTVSYFCVTCWPKFQQQLLAHVGDCGCQVNLVGYHCSLPNWLSLEVCNVTSLPV